ncbi:MAG: hypothetical protein ACOY5B_18385 [Spirochaetota bacterium]
MRNTFTLLLLGGFLVSALAAEEKIFKNRTLRITFEYPADWSVSEDADGVKVASPDGAASVSIRALATKEKVSACEILRTRSEEQKLTNLLPDDKRVVTEEQLRYLGVKDGCLGAFQIVEGDTEVLSGVGLYTSGKRLWLLEQRLRIGQHEKHGAAVSAVAASFTAN